MQRFYPSLGVLMEGSQLSTASYSFTRQLATRVHEPPLIPGADTDWAAVHLRELDAVSDHACSMPTPRPSAITARCAELNNRSHSTAANAASSSIRNKSEYDVHVAAFAAASALLVGQPAHMDKLDRQ